MEALIAPSLNLLIFVGILVYFLRKPVANMVSSRSANLRKEIQEAAAQINEAETKLKELEQKIAAFETEANELIEKSRLDAEALRSKILDSARATATRMVQDAESTVKAKILEAKDQIRRETIAGAVELAEKIIRDRLSAEDQKRIISEYVGKVR